MQAARASFLSAFVDAGLWSGALTTSWKGRGHDTSVPSPPRRLADARAVASPLLICHRYFFFSVSLWPNPPHELVHPCRLIRPARHTVISNRAGRLFLPHSFLRMRRPADVRNPSSP